MRRLMRKAIFVALVLVFGAAAPALAQSREKAWELYPHVGAVKFGSTTGLEDDVSFGFSFSYLWTKHHQIDFGFDGTSTEDSATGQFSADLIHARVNYIYNIFLQRRDRVSLFLTAGAGIVNFSTFGFTTDPDLVGDEADFAYNYGLGFRFFGGHRTGFRVDARKVFFSTSQGGDQDYLEATMGVCLVLGGA